MYINIIKWIKARSEKMIFGYLNVLILVPFVMSETGNVDVNCTARPQSNITLTLDQRSTDVRQLILKMDGKTIASSRNPRDGWNEFILESYKKRLFLKTSQNITIHLWNVTNADEATYETTIFSKEGKRSKSSWSLKLKNFTKPELTEDKLKITVEEVGDRYHCQCGTFKTPDILQLSFTWNISNHNVHVLNCTRNESVTCTASWPVSECQDVIFNETAEHRGEPATDGGNQNGAGRRKRSTDDTGCVPADNTSPESTDEATTGHTEVTTVNNDVVVAVTVAIAVIVVVVTVTTTACCLRRKKKQYPKNRNVGRSEHETKDSPNEEKMEMIN